MVPVYIPMGCIPKPKDAPSLYQKEKTTPKGVETEGLICIFAEGKNKGVAAIELSASNSPPDCCNSFSSPPVIAKQKTPSDRMGFLFGGDWGTRTLDLMRVKHAL